MTTLNKSRTMSKGTHVQVGLAIAFVFALLFSILLAAATNADQSRNVLIDERYEYRLKWGTRKVDPFVKTQFGSKLR